MTRLVVSKNITMSPKVEERFKEERDDMYSDNHTYRDHNMYTYPRDTMHTME
jgi:hypothetical protein